MIAQAVGSSVYGEMMKRSDLTELHYITPIGNIPSILEHGLLSNRLAQRYDPTSVALPGVQAIRARRRLPSGRGAHEHVNLYFHARNPMMYYLKDQHHSLAVLRIDPNVLDLPGAFVADGNVSRENETAFWVPGEGLARLDRELVFAEWWSIGNEIERYERKRIRCAEVLIPDRVDSAYVRGVYVSCRSALESFQLTTNVLTATIEEHMFFHRGH